MLIKIKLVDLQPVSTKRKQGSNRDVKRVFLMSLKLEEKKSKKSQLILEVKKKRLLLHPLLKQEPIQTESSL